MSKRIFLLILTTILLSSIAKPFATAGTSEPVTRDLTKYKYTSEIEIKRGEKWWGIFVSEAPMEPFLQPFKINTADSPLSGLYAPVMLSSSGRYIWSEEPIAIEFDGEVIRIGSDHEKIKVAKGGRTLRDAYLVCRHKHTPPRGDFPDPQLFKMPLYETEIELGRIQGEQEIIEYASQIVKRGLPQGIIVIADGWNTTSSDYTFDSELYPDPPRMVKTLQEMGFKVMLTVTPHVAAAGKKFATALERGLLARDQTGKPIVFTTNDQSHVAFYDVSQLDQLAIIAHGLKEIEELGVEIDGYRFDCSDVLSIIEDGEKKDRFIENWLTLGDSRTMCDFQISNRTPLAPHINNIELRGEYEWEQLTVIINNMISAGLVGFPYSHISTVRQSRMDMPKDDKLLAAWIQLFAIMPVMKIEFAPWRISDPELYQSVVETIKMRVAIGPYIAELVEESARTGEPLLRHMEYQFQNMGFADCNDQFMLGSKYLFAPNISDTPRRLVRLPKGLWSDRNGAKFRGPVVTEVDNGDGRTAWFKLEGK